LLSVRKFQHRFSVILQQEGLSTKCCKICRQNVVRFVDVQKCVNYFVTFQAGQTMQIDRSQKIVTTFLQLS
jgi:hypothetical protein